MKIRCYTKNMFSCCDSRVKISAISHLQPKHLNPSTFSQKTIWNTFPENTIFVNTANGREYFYAWSELRVHPNFIVTQWAIATHHKHIVFTRRLEPQLYEYVYRYIRYGIRLDISGIANRLLCSTEDVHNLLAEYGITSEEDSECVIIEEK